MTRKAWLARGAIVVAFGAAIAGCSDTKELVRPAAPLDPIFTSYVSLGNSITAGLQSGGINSTTQSESYAVLLAQKMGTPFSVPYLQLPGCPPPIDNILTGHRVGDATGETCALRADMDGQAVINNVAVPNATSSDPTDPLGAGANNALSTIILGGRTQVQRALEARPTFASVWIGNNDVLTAAVAGILTPMPGISPGLTDVGSFTQHYSDMILQLTGQSSGESSSAGPERGVLVGVVNVTAIPLFMPAAAILNPQVKAAAEAFTGKSLTVDGSCTPTTQSLIDFRLLLEIKNGTQPATIACSPVAGDPGLLGDIFVLDAGEIATITQTVAAYNAAIQAQADQLGWAYADPNPTLAQLRQSGAVPLVPDLTNPAAPFGQYFSLDGVHPSAAGQALLADLIATAINDKYGTTLPTTASAAQ
ncbi:MAG TPA: SGNH/GDSL hydrolase family protein [Gemmatimonadaceae bacterium]|nr:SGNH/GDSL hydrolase family protein [Gemmatimonadaceae bacterium]